MSKIAVLLVGGVVLGCVLIAFFIILVLAIKAGRRPPVIDIIKLINEGKKPSIGELNDFLMSQSPSKEGLGVLSKYVIENLKIPDKAGSKVPPEAKAYLDFVSLYAASANSDAKLIALFNRELRAKNPSYGSEIDEIETKGINVRK